MARHPARLDVQLGDAPVIAIEKSREILGQIALIEFTQRPHDAEIHRREARTGAVLAGQDEEISRMHVGVKEMVAKHLGKKDLDAALGEHLEIDTGAPETFAVADMQPVHALHYQHVFAGVIPEHFRHVHAIGIGEVASQL